MSSMIRQMPLFVFFLFFTLFPLAAAGIFTFAALRARRQAALMKATPTSNIGMAANGYCELEGRAEAIGGELLTAPLTLSKVVWYHAKVEKWNPSRSASADGHWSTIDEHVSEAPFMIRDDTGVCVVSPTGAEVTPSDKSDWYGGKVTPSDRNPPHIDPLESSTPMFQTSGGSNSKFRFHEERIYPDSPLLVLGEFWLRRSAEDDDDDDDSDEGEAAGTPAAGSRFEAEDLRLTDRLQTLARETTRAHISMGAGKKPFIISTKLQAVHVATSELGSQAALWMAAAFAGAAAFMLWVRFGA